jgi:Subtilase family
MEADMPNMNNMQPIGDMKMPMHDTFWRNDQVMVVFHSKLPISEDGVLNKEPLLDDLNIREQLKRINRFLFQKFREQGRDPIHLVFLGDNEKPAIGDRPVMRRFNVGTSPQLPSGVYLFDEGTDIVKSFGTIRTSIHAFFKVVKGQAPDIGDMSVEMASTGNHHDGDHDDEALVPAVVETLNSAVSFLNSREEERVPIALSAPTWLNGGTQVGIGCPLTPPMPVADSCPYWHIELPDVDPQLSATGDEVTVFVLDSFPERGVISRAARDAGSANLLLHNVNNKVSFDYSLMSGLQEIDVMDHTNVASVGKDVYGEHYPILIPDHGLFIAGIVHDIAPDARIECVRVLNSLCVGDLEKLTHALERIHDRMLDEKRDLFQKRVVINLSLVIPRAEEVEKVKPGQIKLKTDDFELIPANLLLAITALQQAGAVIVASAGNEGDGRELPTGMMLSDAMRPPALYPAALGKLFKNIIAVGAAAVDDDAASYSCYPGSYPDDNAASPDYDRHPRSYGLATWGGEVPNAQLGEVDPSKPGEAGSDNPTVTIRDAPRGIYSSVEFPPLSAVPADPPEQYYTASNENAWAYWIGTSFATPIVSAVVARILELDPTVALDGTIYDKLLNLISGRNARWNRLDPAHFPDGKAEGPLLKVSQVCKPYGGNNGEVGD